MFGLMERIKSVFTPSNKSEQLDLLVTVKPSWHKPDLSIFKSNSRQTYMQRMEQYRREHELSQLEMSRLIGCGVSSYTQWLRTNTSPVQHSMKRKFAKVLNQK